MFKHFIISFNFGYSRNKECVSDDFEQAPSDVTQFSSGISPTWIQGQHLLKRYYFQKVISGNNNGIMFHRITMFIRRWVILPFLDPITYSYSFFFWTVFHVFNSTKYVQHCHKTFLKRFHWRMYLLFIKFWLMMIFQWTFKSSYYNSMQFQFIQEPTFVTYIYYYNEVL